MRLLENAGFGAFVLLGTEEGRRTCANGLPIIPSSIRMLGRFEKIKSIEHPSLCRYIELIRSTLVPNAVIMISEHYNFSISSLISSKSMSDKEILHVTGQVVRGISAIHDAGFCIGMLSSDSVLVCNELNGLPTVRITQYANLHYRSSSYTSNDGWDIQGGLPQGFFMAPEQFLRKSTNGTSTFKADIWALGVILLEMATGVLLRSVWSLKQYMNILKCSMSRGVRGSLLDPILRALRSASDFARDIELNGELGMIIERCFSLLPSDRPTSSQLISSTSVQQFPKTTLHESVESLNARIHSNSGHDWILREMNVQDAFFLWRLCGSSVEAILVKDNVITLRHPVLTNPSIAVEDLQMFGNDEARRFFVKPEIVLLPDKNIREKLSTVSNVDIFLQSLLIPPESSGTHNENLSVIVKEKDMIYQASRMQLIGHLVASRFYKLQELRLSVAEDVPPMRRADVWCALLDVRSSDEWNFFYCNTLAVHTSDRQLDVDIPRCHQYEELMTSPAAHYVLRRLLKAWLLSHPHYVYWQGCDSLATPFILLYFNRLQQLAVFYHLLAFVDAKLFTRLKSMDFYPELFAIPWFLTCFAHVLPIHKLFHVWDQLLQRDSSFPLFIGLAIMRQLRQTLIEASFNDVILLFSDLPDFSMEVVTADSISYYDRVPPSCAFRFHAPPNDPQLPPPRGLPCTLQNLPYRELKKWQCPRLSPEEFAWRVSDQLILVIDIRSQIEFGRGCVLRSINYPNVHDTSLLNIAEPMKVAQRNQHPICIVSGKDMSMTQKFSGDMVNIGIDGICVLDGGFETIRHNTFLIHIPH
ncbi:TBC domain protein [Dictyocaulus viviparus]|uniref:TBC domain protein n=1 Tax=Dictyocaulus viviparus TaxID=29172 RepID=A0A0D8XB80_DICVI|nr:TBC domain protein [Dictyocaulus viviparus]